MSQSRDIYNALVEVGVDETRAREFAREETDIDPAELESATIAFTVTVYVELDQEELEGLSVEDEDEMIDLAQDKIVIEGDGVSESSCDGEVVRVDLT